MITVRKSEDRGHFEIDWLDSRHSFSFGEYYDPRHLGFSMLRVINEDKIAPGGGFPTHPHQDMEIVTYVLEGELEHRDSLGTGSIIRPGEVQRMSAGTGIRHSEYNPSSEHAVRLLQIWLIPDKKGVAPSYEQKSFSANERQGRLRLVASSDGRDGSVSLHQDAKLYTTLLAAGERVTLPLDANRAAWVQVAKGTLSLNGATLSAGDGAAVTKEALLELAANDNVEVLVFDLPAPQ
ncbi:MAG: pirin family protein [Rhodospirillaceae bacterium]|nr:MAG: pirin family protein [Rhodospirillaceae bacterium]